MKKKYRGFLINADNTIFDDHRAEKEALYEVLNTTSYSGLSESALKHYHKINKKLWQSFENEKITLNQLKIMRFEELLIKLGIKEDPEKIAASFQDRLGQKAYLIPNSVLVLEKLSKRAVLTLISNGLSYVQRGRIARVELEIFFNDIIISEEQGYPKADPRFFQKAIKSLYLPPHEILCVGESLNTDIKEGQKAGLDTCWFNQQNHAISSQIEQPTYIINNLKQLEDFLPRLS